MPALFYYFSIIAVNQRCLHLAEIGGALHAGLNVLVDSYYYYFIKEQQQHVVPGFLFGAKLGERNPKAVFCRRCGCKIMSKDRAVLERCRNVKMHDAKGDSAVRITEHFFWRVDTLMAFDNVGVTKPLPPSMEEKQENVRPVMPYRYLTCADCEFEPVGFKNSPVHHQEATAFSFAYLSAHRVCTDFDASSADAKLPLVEYRKKQEAKFKAYLTEQMRSTESRKAAPST